MKKLPAFLLIVGVSLSIGLSLVRLPGVLAQESERVGLVVQFDDKTILTRCIETNGEAITGGEVLQLSGLELDLYYDANQEIAVCKLNGQGCDAHNCFCLFPNYWSYWHMEGDEWVYSGRGSSAYLVQPGAVEGWRWGAGAPPSKITYEQICSPASSGETAASLAGAALQTDQSVIQGVEGLDLAPAVESDASSTHPAIASFRSIGYLAFGFTLVAMGFGLLLVLKYSH